MSAPPRHLFLFAGTYTAKDAKGVYLCRFAAKAGALEVLGLAAEMPNPTFLAIHPAGCYLYAVSEVRDESGRHGGSVNAFAVDEASGGLTFLNRQSSQGAGPCHVSVEPKGRFVLVANYESGSAAMLPVQKDGSLGEASDVAQHHGASINPERQEGPHAHSITPSPDGRFAFVCDLGLDRIMVYRLDLQAGRLRPNEPPSAAVKSGAGPRHLVFHPTRPVVYVVTEMGNTVIAFAWDAARGALRETQTVSTLPADFRGESYAADIHVDAAGRFLYASNRGHDSITVFRIDESTGVLSLIGHQPTLGKWPRNFAFDPTGGWLLAANQESDSVAVFRRDPATGLLAPGGAEAKVSMPVCLTFLA